MQEVAELDESKWTTKVQMTMKKPASIMAICAVSSEGEMLTHFIADHEKVNAEVYFLEKLTQKCKKKKLPQKCTSWSWRTKSFHG